MDFSEVAVLISGLRESPSEVAEHAERLFRASKARVEPGAEAASGFGPVSHDPAGQGRRR